MYPAYNLFNVRWKKSNGEFNPNDSRSRDKAIYVNMFANVSPAEACYDIMVRFYGVTPESTETAAFREEHSLAVYDATMPTSAFRVTPPRQFIRGNSDEMRALATAWQQKLPLYESGIKIVEEILGAKPKTITDNLFELSWEERDLAIWKTMGRGLPDEQRQCYKPMRPIAKALLAHTKGDVDDAFVIVAMVERKLEYARSQRQFR